MTTLYQREECCTCYINFHVPTGFHADRVKDKRWFYCPNGHQMHYKGETEADGVRRERDRLKQQLAEKDDQISAVYVEKQKVEQELRAVKKRAQNGVCPCCNRSFSALARHMKTKHPNFKAVA